MGRHKKTFIKCELWLELERRAGIALEARELANLLGHERYQAELNWYRGSSIPDAVSCKELADRFGFNALHFYLYCCELKYSKDIGEYLDV